MVWSNLYAVAAMTDGGGQRLYHVDGTLVTFKGQDAPFGGATASMLVTPDGQHIISGTVARRLFKVWSVATKSLGEHLRRAHRRR